MINYEYKRRKQYRSVVKVIVFVLSYPGRLFSRIYCRQRLMLDFSRTSVLFIYKGQRNVAKLALQDDTMIAPDCDYKVHKLGLETADDWKDYFTKDF
ncbi:unnamed protein product [Thelazia callipaeda]|uniref:Uncharacterized protein n=1 Tax=Thelazia callipaeda TaxID=103827 RepID=A0A0N5CN17_THECL|nr:unnamed protein product [Thelazia callipaeda]